MNKYSRIQNQLSNLSHQYDKTPVSLSQIWAGFQVILQVRYTLFYLVAYSGPSLVPNMNPLTETVSGCKPFPIFSS